MNKFFYDCVRFMEVSAKWLNMTYEEWNVVLFVIIQPALILLFMITTLYYRRKAKRVKLR